MITTLRPRRFDIPPIGTLIAQPKHSSSATQVWPSKSGHTVLYSTRYTCKKLVVTRANSANINKRWMHEESQLQVKTLSGPWVASDVDSNFLPTVILTSVSILWISLAVNMGSSKRTARHICLHTFVGCEYGIIQTHCQTHLLTHMLRG